MRRNLTFVLGLLALSAAGTVSAQELRPVSGVLVQAGLFHGPKCEGEACPEPCKTCVPEIIKKKISTPVYGIKCIDFCLPKCVHGGNIFKKDCGHGHACGHDCGGCGKCKKGPCDFNESCGECGKVRTRRVLLKKFEVCEVDVVSCKVVEQAPVCAPVCTTACPPACVPGTVPGVIYPGTSPAPIEKIGPGKKMPAATGALPLHPSAPLATSPVPAALTSTPIAPITPAAPALPTLVPFAVVPAP